MHKCGHVLLLRVANDVFDQNRQSRVVRCHRDVIDLNQITQRLLQGPLHQELRGGCEFHAVGFEDKLKEPATEFRPVHSFTRGGKQNLFDEVSNMVILRGFRCAPAPIESIWKCNIHRCP